MRTRFLLFLKMMFFINDENNIKVHKLKTIPYAILNIILYQNKPIKNKFSNPNHQTQLIQLYKPNSSPNPKCLINLFNFFLTSSQNPVSE